MSVDATVGVITIEHLPNRYVKTSSQYSDEKDRSSPESYSTDGLPEGFDEILNPRFPCQFERMVDTVFDHVLHRLKMYSSDNTPSQRTVAQLLNVSRHEAAQRLTRTQGK